VERCLACEADVEHSESYGGQAVLVLESLRAECWS